MRTLMCVCLALPCLGSGVACAAIATFDSLTEGDLGPSFTDGGITFFGLNDRAGAGPVPFNIERADGTLSGSGFSPLNALGFSAWVPGPDAAFSQCGEFSFTTGTVQTFGSIDVFEWMSPAGNTISLQALRNGVVVNSDSAVIPGNFQINHWNLRVSGVAFDTLRVIGSGPTDRGIFIGLVDNAVIVPAPCSALGLLGMLAFRRRVR